MVGPQIDFSILNDELLAKPETPKKNGTPKRNTKEELIDRIVNVAQEANIGV